MVQKIFAHLHLRLQQLLLFSIVLLRTVRPVAQAGRQLEELGLLAVELARVDSWRLFDRI